MFGIRARKELALKSILGIDPSQNIPSEYPKKIKLPNSILKTALDLVSETRLDACERASSFMFMQGQWQASRVHVGGEPTFDEQSAMLMADSIPPASLIRRPHFDMHTHPSSWPSSLMAQAERAVEKHNGIDYLSDADKRNLKSFIYSTAVLPSAWDINTILFGTQASGTVGSLVSSEGGHFLTIPEHLRQPLPLLRSKYNSFAHIMNASRMGQSILALQIEAGDLPTHEVGPYLLENTATIVAGKLACYYSNDIQSPYLERIKV